MLRTVRETIATGIYTLALWAAGAVAPQAQAPSPPPETQAASAYAPASELFRNQPSGWVTLFDQPWSSLPSDAANGWSWNASSQIDIRTDRPGGISPGTSLRHRVPAGTQGRAGGLHAWTRAIPDNERYASEVYFAIEHIWSPSWVNHAIGVKDLWPQFERGGNSPYTTFDGPQMRVGVNFQGERWGNRNLRANVGPRTHQNLGQHKGKPVLIEYYMRINTVNSRGGERNRADGIVRAWVTVDGVTQQVMDYSDVKFVEVDAAGRPVCVRYSPCGTFRQLRLNPTYGGSGTPAPYEMERWIGHIRVAVPSRR